VVCFIRPSVVMLYYLESDFVHPSTPAKVEKSRNFA